MVAVMSDLYTEALDTSVFLAVYEVSGILLE